MTWVEVEPYSIPRQLFEVYKTDEEHFEEYVPNGGEEKEEDNEESSETDDESEEEEETEVEEDNQGFKLHQGEIMEKYFYISLKDINYSYDYDDISSSGDITLPYSEVNLDECYLGVRCLLRKDWEKHGEKVALKELSEALLCFITDESFSDYDCKLGLSGMGKLMERKYEFSFSQMLRSKIIEEVIKTAGLEPVVDPTGLDDQVIDYTNVSSSDDGDDSSVDDSNLPADVCKATKQIIKGAKTKKAKAQKIYAWIDSHSPYRGYSNTEIGWDKVYAHAKAGGSMNCCDHAHLSVQMLRCAGIKANYIHVTGHVYAVAYLPDRTMFDPLGYQNRPMGTVARGYPTDGTELETLGF